jgi:tryptophan-rich sensory protein
VWSVLYLLIAVSYGYVLLLCIKGTAPYAVLLPLILNLITNALYTPLQFGLRNLWLATIDILLVLATLIWTLLAVYPYTHWASLINLPYLAWVCFATILQISITILNPRQTY